ncbi:MAG: biotin/lipoyl-containing protein, partial [Agromyces sp.]
MSEIRFPLPDVGEGLTEAEIVQWRVAPGDRIALDQVFVEIETAKSLVELPSAFEGVVSELLVEEGNTVDVGTPILVIQTDAAGPASDAPVAPATESAPVYGRAPVAAPDVAEESGAVLVGHGSSGPAATRRKRHATPDGAHGHLAPVTAP